MPTPRVVDKTGLTGVYEFRLGFQNRRTMRSKRNSG